MTKIIITQTQSHSELMNRKALWKVNAWNSRRAERVERSHRNPTLPLYLYCASVQVLDFVIAQSAQVKGFGEAGGFTFLWKSKNLKAREPMERNETCQDDIRGRTDRIRTKGDKSLTLTHRDFNFETSVITASESIINRTVQSVVTYRCTEQRNLFIACGCI